MPAAAAATDWVTEKKRGLPNYNYKRKRITFFKAKLLQNNQSAEAMVSAPIQHGFMPSY